MKKNILLAIASSFLIACGGGGGEGGGGFQGPNPPELNVNFAPNVILPNPTGARLEALSGNAVANVEVYARQGNTPIENGTRELLISLNNTIGTVPGVIYCNESGNNNCIETIRDASGSSVEVRRPLGKVQLDLAGGRGFFSVAAANGQVGEIGINVTVIGPNNSTVSKDIKIPVRYPTSGRPYNVSIIAPDAINPNSAANALVRITDEAGNPVENPSGNNLIVTANNLAGTTLGFNGETGVSVNAKTATGLATISVLPTANGNLTLVAQADAADNNIENGIQDLVTVSKVIQVTNAAIPPTQNIAITTSQLPNGVAGVNYESFRVATTGSTAVNVVLSAGSLPPGMVFSQGVLSGRPTLAGSYTFTVTATGANGSTATQQLTLTVITGGFTFDKTAFETISMTRNDDPAIPDVCSSQAQTLTLQPAAGYTPAPPFTWRMDANGVATALGAGNNATRVITANGVDLPDLDFTVTNNTTQVVMSGTICPSAPADVPGGHAIILSATDANGFTFESVLPLIVELTVNAFTPKPIADLKLPGATVNSSYAALIPNAVSATGLPSWLTLSEQTVTGTPTVAGTYNFVVTLTDGQVQNVSVEVK